MAENRPDETVTDVPLESTPEGDSKVDDNNIETKPSVEGLSLEDINTLSGRDYQTLEDAQAGVKETFDYVGKAGQEKQVLTEELEKLKSGDNSGSQEVLERMAQVEKELFFSANPKVNRSVAEMVAKAEGIPLSEAIENDRYKEFAGKIATADETEQAKSVLQSNPRLGGAEDRMAKAKELMKEGHDQLQQGNRGASIQAVESAQTQVVKGVVEAFDM